MPIHQSSYKTIYLIVKTHKERFPSYHCFRSQRNYYIRNGTYLVEHGVASFAFLRPNLQFFAFFQLLWLFFTFEKMPNEFWLFLALFGHLHFYVDLQMILADFWAMADFHTLFLDTMINFCWKVCTRIYNFLFCCLILLRLQFHVAFLQDQKFWEVY